MDAARHSMRRVGGGLARWARRGLARHALPHEGSFWVSLELPSPIADASPHAFTGDGTSLLGLLQVLEAAAEEPRVEGVLLRIAGAPGGLAKAQSLRRAIQAVRTRGKRIVAWSESLDLESLYVASAADRIWIPETGRVFVVGLRIDGVYLRDLLARFDVKPDLVRIGTHKSAGEMFTEGRMSDNQREQLEAVVDDAFDALVAGIAAGRGLEAARVRELIDRGPFGARGACEVGLVDACLYRDEIEEGIAREAARGTDRPGEPRWVDARALPALRAAAGARELWTERPRIAYVVAEGAIVRGKTGRGIASEAHEATLHRLTEDPNVRGVVLRIDSPGGDALASDLLWRAVRTLRREKPVVASLAEVAASGGYYLASAADWVFAEPSMLTGSIGVIGGKFDLGGLYRRYGVGRDAVERGARAGMLTDARGFTEDERDAVRAEMHELYEAFVARVAEGRGLTRDAVLRGAEGRVWSGSRALGLGLVDGLGGPLEALREARRRAGLRAEAVLLEHHPRVPPALRAIGRWLR
jgi:protease-4